MTERIKNLVERLHGETDDERRGGIYQKLRTLAKPRWFRTALVAAAWSVYYKGLTFGIVSPFPELICLDGETAERFARKMGAKDSDFDLCYQLAVEMQWDLLDAENVGTIVYILNG